jgi:hypothetical protein
MSGAARVEIEFQFPSRHIDARGGGGERRPCAIGFASKALSDGLSSTLERMFYVDNPSYRQ